MKKEATTGFIGFSSPQDFLNSLVGTKTWLVNGVAAMCAGMTSFITNYIWDDPVAVYTLWSLMFADWVTGIIKATMTNRFVSFKIWRMPLYFIATSYLLHISWYMAKGNILYVILPGIIIGGFYSVYFISLLENLGEINMLPKSLVRVLKSRFGLKKLILELEIYYIAPVKNG
jgi:phage-related holin